MNITLLKNITEDNLHDLDYINQQVAERHSAGKTEYNDSDTKKLTKIISDAKAAADKAELAKVKAEEKAELAKVKAEEKAAKAEEKAELAKVKAEEKAELARVKAEEKAAKAEEKAAKAEEKAELAKVKAEEKAELARVKADEKAAKAEEKAAKAEEKAAKAELAKVKAEEKAETKKDIEELNMLEEISALLTTPTYITTAAHEELIYTYSSEDNRWLGKRLSGYQMNHNLTRNHMETLYGELIATGKMKHDKIFTFQKVGSDTFSPMVKIREGWTQPDNTSGPVRLPDCVEILLTSLSNGRRAEREMLEKVIWRKYTHPEDYQIPALMIYGEGASGKNTLMNLLGSIYGSAYIPVMKFAQAFGQFSGGREGAVAIAIDEAPHDKNDADAFKAVVGNLTASIDIKYGAQKINIPNTAQYFLFTNHLKGSLLLSGGAVDRRYEILHTKRTLYHTAADYYDLAKGEDEGEVEGGVAWREVESEILDKKTAALFLRYLKDKYGELNTPLTVFHGDDYKELLERQVSPLVEYARLIFNDPNFTNITRKKLYEGFKFYISENNPGKKYPMNSTNFHLELGELINKKEVGAVEHDPVGRVNMRTAPGAKTYRKYNAYIRMPQPKNLFNTDEIYTDNFGKFRLPDESEPADKPELAYSSGCEVDETELAYSSGCEVDDTREKANPKLVAVIGKAQGLDKS